MMNPIRNIERAPGPGGPEFSLAGKPPSMGYDPLRHRPHNYPVKRLSKGLAVHIAIPKLQEGGQAPEEPDSSDEPMPENGQTPDAQDLQEPDEDLSPDDQQKKEIVTEAMAALRGQHPDPEKAIQRFIDTFGEADFQELRQMVMGKQGEPDEDDMGGPPDSDEDDTGGAPPQGVPGSAAPAAPGGMQVGGLLRGPGAGQDDQIEAATPTGRKVLLSDGEYVIDAPTVAALGDGSTNAGARRLDQFRKEIRRQAYGHDKQAKAMRRGGRAMLEALNS